jgi:hypothetical protein
MKANIVILENNFEVEFDFEITASGSPEIGPSFSSGGEPAEPAEFAIEILSLCLLKSPELILEVSDWLKDLLVKHLEQNEDVNAAVQDADRDRGSDFDDNVI